MLTEEQISKIYEHELYFITSRSGGKGGQNVNKVESKVELIFNLGASSALSEVQKKRIFATHSARVKEGFIHIRCDKDRSQLKNKQTAKEKLIILLNQLLTPKKKRIATQPGKKAKENKLKLKKQVKDKKQLRKKIHLND